MFSYGESIYYSQFKHDYYIIKWEKIEERFITKIYPEELMESYSCGLIWETRDDDML